MDWIHCNYCYSQPNDSKKFSLTTCGHLFCEDCVGKGKEKCKVCGQQCMALVLAAPLKQDVAVYFTEPCETLQQHFKEIAKVMDFQKGHGRRLLAFSQQKATKLNKELEEALTKLKDREKEIENLKKENENLKHENENMKKVFHQSPFSKSSGVMSQSISSCSSAISMPSLRTPASTPRADVSKNTPMSLTSTPITTGRLSIFTFPTKGRLGLAPQHSLGNAGGSAPGTLVNPPMTTSSLSIKRQISQSSGPDTCRSTKSNYTSLPYDINGQNQILTNNYSNLMERKDTTTSQQRRIGLMVNYPLRTEIKNYLASK